MLRPPPPKAAPARCGWNYGAAGVSTHGLSVDGRARTGRDGRSAAAVAATSALWTVAACSPPAHRSSRPCLAALPSWPI